MKNKPNELNYFHSNIFMAMGLSYILFSVFGEVEFFDNIKLLGSVEVQNVEVPSSYLSEILKLDLKAFLIDVAWYLFLYFLFEFTNKVLSMIDIVATIIGKQPQLNIKLLNKYCTLLLLMIGGKFIVFVFASLI